MQSWPALLEIRTGQVARLRGTNIHSGIGKRARTGAVLLGTLGVEGDAQGEPIIHGGPDKAVLHYAAAHYAAWQAEFPALTALLVPGGFGENLVSHGPDEASLCIGDVVQIGAARLQICQPRQPCFKLNHRFGTPELSRRTQETGRTGWYYRVLQPGLAAAGDAVVLLDRLCPSWSIRRVQHVLYTDTLNVSLLEELAALPELAAAMRGLFAKRLQGGAVEDWQRRLVDDANPVTPLMPQELAAIPEPVA